ncbi:MAG: molybdenum cofactor guanylyltransferase [Psychrobacter sp.]|uniref:molybdenum cofactor guanylyltransferase n=1 Tax=Psychrobacter sp. AOP7-B1-24 TaxID=3457645 RepID=UPI003FB75A35
MMNAFNPLAGIVVLAGGASKRMGTPKAELVLPTGERLLDYHVRHALELNAVHTNLPIMIADNGRGFAVDVELMQSRPPSSVFHISDYIAHESDEQMDTAGALAAIESAMQTLIAISSSEANQVSPSSWLLVVSCDSLIPVTDLWRELQQVIVQAVDKKVICLTDEHHLYPLLGLYRLSIEPDLQAYIDNNQRRVIPFIKPIVQSVPFAKSWQHLTNFNTPEDFEQACVALSNL